MELTNKGLQLIKKYEDFRNNPHLSISGIPKIGYGNTHYEDGSRVQLTDLPIMMKDAENLLKSILNQFEEGVKKLVTSDINQKQFDALVSLSYNIGLSALSSSTLIKKVNDNPEDESIKEEFQKWNKSNGEILKQLKKRRNEEIFLYFQND